MDAIDPSARPTFATRTPLHIASVALKARNLERLVAYYRQMLGLTVLDRGEGRARLGAGGVPLLVLEHDPQARPDDPRDAGLYHTAFLMPTRADLARWVLHIARNRIPITGASDHTVSEAFYLDDPEGNGVEVYCDRDPAGWLWTGDFVKITTDPLDIEDILREVDPARADYGGAPAGLRIGHIHLRVGDVAAAEHFYRDGIGLTVTRAGRFGATFMSSGRYHHHLAGNVWHSLGAGRRDPTRAGLSCFTIAVRDPAEIAAIKARLAAQGAPLAPCGAGIETADPWGTCLRVQPASDATPET